jgi:hypothetical protein
MGEADQWSVGHLLDAEQTLMHACLYHLPVDHPLESSQVDGLTQGYDVESPPGFGVYVAEVGSDQLDQPLARPQRAIEAPQAA